MSTTKAVSSLPIHSDNPCAACTIAQDCCSHLSGLRVTESEFEQCFAHHADVLTIEREGPVYVLTPRGGGACPNWRDGGCAVYDSRPRECALFPYTMFVRNISSDRASLGYHNDTRCPLKNQLCCSDEEARVLMESFGREAFPNVPLEVRRESTGERLKRRLRDAVHRIRSSLDAAFRLSS